MPMEHVVRDDAKDVSFLEISRQLLTYQQSTIRSGECADPREARFSVYEEEKAEALEVSTRVCILVSCTFWVTRRRGHSQHQQC
jgi:hypothetical protein